MPNSYPSGGIFNPHLTTIKNSYIVKQWQPPWPLFSNSIYRYYLQIISKCFLKSST